MDTHKKIREHISALSDGALPKADLELAFAALQGADGRHAWDTYYRIGDVLRARATPELSDGFSARLAQRLAAEPAPVVVKKTGGAAARGAGQGEPEAPVAVAAKPAVADAS